MKVYLQSKQDWIDFVSGKAIVAYKKAIENHYKAILVAFNEILDNEVDTVTIVKKY